MSKMRGVDSFEKLWRRRVSIELPDQTKCEVLSLPDLLQAKKTQRDKDWPMIRRLVEAHYFLNRERATVAQVRFWLKELRTPELLTELCHSNHALARQLSGSRPLLLNAIAGDLNSLAMALATEEATERERDRLYWAPLRRELEALRRIKRG